MAYSDASLTSMGGMALRADSRNVHVHCPGIDVSSGAPLPRNVGAPNATGSFVDVYIYFVLVCLSADADAALVMACHNEGVSAICMYL